MTKAKVKAASKRKPPIVLSKEEARVLDINLVEQAAALLTDKQMLAFFDITAEEWEKMCSSHPELLGAPERGRARKTFDVAQKLLDKVNEGNLEAIKFYLKSRGQYREDGENVHIGSLGAITSISVTAVDSIEAAKIYSTIMKGA